MELNISKDNRFLEISKIDSITELDQIRHILTRKVKNYRFHPAVKNGSWDGSVVFYDKNDRIPIGLWKFCHDKMKTFGYNFNIPAIKTTFDDNIKEDEFTEFVNEQYKDSKLKPRDYQNEAAFRILKYKKTSSLMATSSGKTLVIYTVLSYAFSKNLIKNVLMIVPNVSLVIQATNDFYEYNRGHDVRIRVQQIYHGQEEYYGTNITIGTYQSLVKLDSDFFKKFDAVVVDELHRASSKSIIDIMKNLNHVNYRLGLTGTLPNETTAEYLTIISQTGPVVNKVTADSLIQEGFVTPISITIMRMDYLDIDTKKSLYELSKRIDGSKLFTEEKKLIIANKKRLDFIVNIVAKGKMNSLVLFHQIEYGKKLYEELKKIRPNDVYYISGVTKADIREDYKKFLERKDGQILVASFGTLSTGVSIKNIHNIFLTESFKSDVIINQSLGRGLRLHKDKQLLNVIDFVDDFSFLTDYGFEYINYIFKHGKERITNYKKQNFPFNIREYKF